jgi:hypothetical protein
MKTSMQNQIVIKTLNNFTLFRCCFKIILTNSKTFFKDLQNSRTFSRTFKIQALFKALSRTIDFQGLFKDRKNPALEIIYSYPLPPNGSSNKLIMSDEYF